MMDHQPQTAESDHEDLRPAHPWESETSHRLDDSKSNWTEVTVPIFFENPNETGSHTQPVTLGLPLPPGRLFSVRHATLESLTAEAANSLPSIPAQCTLLSQWSDGSYRWLLVDFQVPSLPPGKSQWQIRLSPKDMLATENSIQSISDGRNECWGRESSNPDPPLQHLLSDGRKNISAQFQFTNSQGQTHTLQLSDFRSNSDLGQVRSTGLLETELPASIGLQCRLRLTHFKSCNLARLQVTLHNPGRAHHDGGLWDLGDPGSVQFQSWKLKLSIESKDNHSGEPLVAWLAEPADSPKFGQDVLIYQDSSGGENWRGPVHMNRSGRVPCQFRGYRAKSGSTNTSGLRANPTVALRQGKAGVAVAVPEFWQQFPLSLQADSSGIEVGLFPSQWNDQLELQGGEQKTHAIWLEFHTDLPDAPEALLSVVERLSNIAHSPIRVACTPEWYAEANAMPSLTPASIEGVHPVCQEILTNALVGEQSLFAKRETIDEYGWRNYGDVWADHEQAYFKGSGLVVSHYNNQFDMIAGGLRQFMQSGDSAWWSFVAPLARHVIDIDLYHTTLDRAAYNGGLFWFTDHYYSAATSTHRTYSLQNAPQIEGSQKRSDYGGGPGSEHNFATGLLYYYWMTGEPDAAEAVRTLADWVIAMDDGRENVLGLLDDGPTGLASMSTTLDYQGPGRGAANSMQVLLDGWLLTENEKYLTKCEEILRRVIHPDDDIASFNLLDAEHRWSYTMFLAVIVRYLQVKAEMGTFDENYAYAQASLIAYARWMADHERPYLDHPEHLQFPTEAWAAQDLRKANVLRLAAQYESDAVAADKMRRRGEELANRAWQDLQTFPTRQTARAVAIVMTEGSIDGYLRANRDSTMPNSGPTNYNFGKPEKFVPQKLRIRNQSRSVLGIAKLFLSALRPAAWFRLIAIYDRHSVRKLR